MVICDYDISTGSQSNFGPFPTSLISLLSKISNAQIVNENAAVNYAKKKINKKRLPNPHFFFK